LNPQSLPAPGLQPGPLPVTVYLRVPSNEQGAGFEPAKACATGFADRPLRPLGNPCVTHVHRQHARRESNPRHLDLESSALPAELQAYVHPSSTRPEGFEPPASGSVIRRSGPAELRAHLSSSSSVDQAPGRIRTFGLRTGGPALRPSELQAHLHSHQPHTSFDDHRCAAAGAPPEAEKTHGPGSRVRQAGGILPRRVPTRTALLYPNPSFQTRERRPAFPGTSGRQGALPPAPFGPAGAAKALRRSTSHWVSEIHTPEPRTAARIQPLHRPTSPRGKAGIRIRARRAHASHALRRRLRALADEGGVGVHRTCPGQFRVRLLKVQSNKNGSRDPSDPP
jgi:hypothetical protein